MWHQKKYSLALYLDYHDLPASIRISGIYELNKYLLKLYIKEWINRYDRYEINTADMVKTWLYIEKITEGNIAQKNREGRGKKLPTQ